MESAAVRIAGSPNAMVVEESIAPMDGGRPTVMVSEGVSSVVVVDPLTDDARMLKEYVPLDVGTPVIAPVVVFSVRPVGNAPDCSSYDTTPPPVAVTESA